MTARGLAEIAATFGLLLALAIPLGAHMARVYEGHGLTVRLLGPVERALYRVAGVDPEAEMSWKEYGLSLLLFNAAGLLALYGLQRVQHLLPGNPLGLGAVGPAVAWNTAVSFTSNTNWQSYGGESTMSLLTQALGLTVQNFASAASGMAVLVALVRGFTRRQASGLGNFWVDLTRSTLHVLLPLSFLLAVLLSAGGVVQTFRGSVSIPLVEATADARGAKVTEQLVPLGPVASQVAVKQLGTNGGGFYNANSAHPLENANPYTNLLELLSILLIPAALCFTFGALVKDRRQGWALFAAMAVILVPLTFAAAAAEQAGNPLLSGLGVDQAPGALQPGGNMEGKEARFGPVASATWAAFTTAASNGSVNAMHDSFTPLGGLVPMWLMQLGEQVFGGVGSGLYGMLVYALVAVFIAGLMVGRTPEYLGKKVEAYEVKMASLAILLPTAAVHLGTALACALPAGTETLGNPGIHGFSEILYAFSSASNNNGSAFGGLDASGTFYATALAVCMLVGRYWVILPVLAMAGSLAGKKYVPPGAGTLPTHGPLFVALLAGVVLLVGALTFLPPLALGPIAEHLQLFAR